MSKQIETKIKRIIERTKNNNILWTLEDGFYKAKSESILSLELKDNIGFCENCCEIFSNICCENPVPGEIILTGFCGIIQYDYYDIPQSLLKELKDMIKEHYIVPKLELCDDIGITRTNLLDKF